MKITILKRLVVILMVAAILALAVVGVSAEDKYLTLTDYGFGTCISSNTTGGYILKSPTYVSDASKNFTLSRTSGTLFVYWAFPIKQDYTYTCTFSFTLNSSSRFSLSKLGSPLYSNVLAGYNDTVSVSSDKVLYSLTVDTANSTSVTGSVSVSFNPALSGIGLNDIYLYAMLKMSNSNDTGVTCSIPGFGVSCKYDPGGSEFSDYLEMIYSYGDGNDLPDGSEIKSQGSAMSSAEGAVRDKSSDLVSSVSEDWTQYQTVAKNAAVSLKPAAATVNNIYALILDAVPDEVIALFIAIALLLFIGWLIGRVRE